MYYLSLIRVTRPTKMSSPLVSQNYPRIVTVFYGCTDYNLIRYPKKAGCCCISGAVYVCCLLQSSIPSATGSAGIPLSHSIDMAAGIPAGDMYNCTTVVVRVVIYGRRHSEKSNSRKSNSTFLCRHVAYTDEATSKK